MYFAQIMHKIAMSHDESFVFDVRYCKAAKMPAKFQSDTIINNNQFHGFETSRYLAVRRLNA